MEWISVKEKKPEINQIVVAWLHNLKEPSCVLYTQDKHGDLWNDLVEGDIWDYREDLVSHWMPLPNPPEEPIS